MSNRRRSKRLEIAVPVRIRLLGTGKHPPTIEIVTKNISPLGISIELQVNLTNGVFFIQEGEKPVNLIPYLVLENKEVELEVSLPPHEKKVRARGRVIWYDFGSGEVSYYFRAGILFFLKQMDPEERKTWEEFVRNTALETGKLWQKVQIGGAFSFIAGVLIFLAGFASNLATTAKIGILLSSIGFIGFIVAWWQYRSLILFKKFKIFD
jgi:hypothetical protein